MSNFLVSSSSLNKANTGKPAQNINLSFKLEGFSHTLILVFANENCCLCICVTKLYIFCWLLVVSLVILIAVPFVFSRSVNIACRSPQNASRIKRFWRLHIDKTIKWKIDIINSLLCRSVTLLMFIQTLDHSSHCKSENWLAVLVIFEIFLTV